ncbi:arylsulfatase [Ideonella livida]|uniref:Arylsulfatase n=1 Tax=Ideonella livida TaxID=2707176 RepID=A0A7C9PIZ4_9BURK|nr:arylsulfatase [Ideonella livida]NDY93197.1 arylsulfatase [Ideonella livida]
MSNAPRITLIHAVQVAMPPIEAALAQLWPQAQAEHLLDAGLSPALAAAGQLTPALHARIHRLTAHALANGSHGVLFTCSAFGPAIEAAAAAHAAPVLKPNAAMFEAALAAAPPAGGRLVMLATFPSAVASMEAEFHALCAAQGRTGLHLHTLCLPEALAAAQAGRWDEHDQRHLAVLPQLAGFDAVLLAHFSNAGLQTRLQALLPVPVLAAPQAAVQALRARLGG